MKSFLEVLKTRKSSRRFTDKKVPMSLIKKVLELATYAPTPCNHQLWDFVVVTKKEIKKKLVNEAAASTIILRAPVVIVVSYDGWHYKEAVQSGALAVENMHLAANYFSLGGLAMNSYGSDKKIKKILGMPESHVICCFFLLGYQTKEEKMEPLVKRRDLNEVIHFNRFRKKHFLSYSYNPDKWTIQEIKEYQERFCRKTWIGKPMDILSNYELELVKKELEGIKEPAIDIFSYDGIYLPYFPLKNVISINLGEETSLYTIKTSESKNSKLKINTKIYDKKKSFGEAKTITLIYKLERLPKKTREKIIKQSFESLVDEGELIIIARKNNLFYSLFYNFIKFKFGDDVRKTGIYAFFGPYKPISLKETKLLLEKSGFSEIKIKEHFLFPAFFEQAYQIFLQWKKSEGSTFLHRKRQENLITKLFDLTLKIQGFVRLPFGNVVIIKARKYNERQK
ncbi:MAG: nitroreductase family protein [Candidatus Woesearchaeota archaeon]